MSKAAPTGTAEGRRRAALRRAQGMLAALKQDASPDALARAAGALLVAERPRDALRVLRRLLTRHPNHLKGRFLAARAQEVSGQAREALALYRTLAQKVPPWAEPHAGMARCARTLGLAEVHRGALAGYLDRAPGDHQARRALAAALLSAGASAAAAQQLGELATRGVASTRDRAVQARALLACDRPGEAAAVLEEAFAEAPRALPLGVELARVRLRRGEYARALDACSRVLARAPSDPGALGLAAESSLRLGEPDRALVHLERLRSLRPRDPALRLRFAEVLLASGDLTEADRQLTALLAQDPRQPRAALRLAEVRRLRGQRDQARDLYGRCLAADPGHPLALLRVGQLALDEGDPKAALAPLRRLVMSRPDNPVAHRWLGLALRKAGRLADARRSLERSLELDPRDAVAALELGHALREARALPGAQAAYRKVLELAPATEAASRAAYELGHLQPRAAEAPARKARPAKILPFRAPRPERELGTVAPALDWKRPA